MTGEIWGHNKNFYAAVSAVHTIQDYVKVVIKYGSIGIDCPPRNGLPGQLSVQSLAEVQVRLVEEAEVERWNQLMADHHYLGFRTLVGESREYIATFNGQWAGLHQHRPGHPLL